jgi:antitoxin component of MazEF toxin-antitoxin module
MRVNTKYNLDEMLASISEDNLHQEISTGESLGNEILPNNIQN